MTPHTEPESLAGWARRTAPTLTDEAWTFWLSDEPINIHERAALLAELDRIAGDLTEQMRRELAGEEHGWPLGSTAVALRKRGLMVTTRKLDWRDEWRTPLGRAVLARKAAQR